jgi:hypothetical protein
LSVEDFIEFLKLLNKRPYSSYTTGERAADVVGNEEGVSAAGDTVGPSWGPETVTGGGTGGETFSHPFKLTTSVVSGTPKYKVAKGAITDGTNGAAIDLSSILEVDNTATAGYVVLEATVDASMVITGWALAIKTSVDDTEEVKMTTSEPIRQEGVRLLIGKLTLAESVATPWQAQFTSVVISTRLLNGVEVKTFDAAPTIASGI